MPERDPPMPQRERSIIFSGRYLDVIWEEGVEYTHNRRSRGVVLIIPVTAENEIVLLEHYRVPLQRAVIEYPAGLVGDEAELSAETFEDAARRELLEESGYEAGELEPVMRGPASPGSSTEVVTFYLACNACKVHEGGGAGHERIRVHAVKLDQAQQWLATKEQTAGLLVDPRVHLGIYLARERLEGR